MNEHNKTGDEEITEVELSGVLDAFIDDPKAGVGSPSEREIMERRGRRKGSGRGVRGDIRVFVGVWSGMVFGLDGGKRRGRRRGLGRGAEERMMMVVVVAASGVSRIRRDQSPPKRCIWARWPNTTSPLRGSLATASFPLHTRRRATHHQR